MKGLSLMAAALMEFCCPQWAAEEEQPDVAIQPGGPAAGKDPSGDFAARPSATEPGGR